ncbi:hypothetical protein NAEGRDRAFT_38363 [Naegleria gruberi]|uniref:3-hydroxybutyryl-CoA dehydrogenase n=1 Tax=Naegleria gruberi TaxID=5762 RepID=D2V7B8_NAEGR|nr:uncharacterized protein NAEGRDRAFT_38363 [Naegleria gruberi]EFC47226.1 hypothetical protein NAEGRDRAFT_38363 [Naegleria gruberi]|eukprot:XP_002679970.1 hypothetical protein NAEGRDRAFT_38363 [Naegleria gruberi strain NEG-M]
MSSSTTTHTLPTKFSVIGAGQMGTGIAVVAAMNAKVPSVNIHDVFPSSIEKSKKFIESLLDKYVQKGTLTQQEKEIILGERLSFSSGTDLSPMADSQFVVEAATENTDLKLGLFKDLSELVHSKPSSSPTILATNTSSISITKIAAVAKDPTTIIGMHFMNPVPVMKLVELIRGLQTSDATYERTVQLAEAMQKTCTLSIKDSPGFIANRILMPYINEAVNVLHEGIATKEDIDKTMKLGTNVPMGPLTLADFIGLDTCLAIMRVLYTEFADSKYRPSPLLVKMVEAGWLGKKTGRGFYTY